LQCPGRNHPMRSNWTLHAKIGELTLGNDFWKARSAKPAC